MFHKVLVPVDLTDRHQPALDIAAKLLVPNGEVLVLHVVEVLAGLDREEEASFYQRLERKARAHLERLLGRLKDQKVTARSTVLVGETVPEILRYAQQEGIDLIALTSHPVEPDKPGAGWRTTSYLIGIAARCPVLLMK